MIIIEIMVKPNVAPELNKSMISSRQSVYFVIKTQPRLWIKLNSIYVLSLEISNMEKAPPQ